MIYLASTSPRRKAILKWSGIPFRAVKPDYKEEKSAGNLSPSTVVKKHALAKAMSVAKKVRRGVVIGADTVVYFRGKIIGKPKHLKEAAGVLGALAGRWHSVYTGVALLKISAGTVRKKIVFYEKTRVHLKPMDRTALGGYFMKIRPFDKAAASAIQSKRAGIVREIRGSYSNAVGLPVEKLCDSLEKL